MLLSGDSYYEYLLKQWLQTGRTERVYWDRYAAAMRAASDHSGSRHPPTTLRPLPSLPVDRER
jgi:mannosyl-oligosaccharide alpha-1,2-mannosidase